jgi:hypothetical protein
MCLAAKALNCCIEQPLRRFRLTDVTRDEQEVFRGAELAARALESLEPPRVAHGVEACF